MGNLFRGLRVWAGRVQRWVDHVAEPHDETAGTPNPERNTKDDHAVTAPVIRSELQIPQAVIDRYEAHERDKKWSDRWKLRIEGATLVAVIAYAIITLFLWGETRETNRVARQQLVTARRPWVALKGTPRIGPLVFDDSGASIEVSISVKNWGLSPAMKVKAMVDLLVTVSLEQIRAKQESRCRSDRLRAEIKAGSMWETVLLVPWADEEFWPFPTQTARSDFRLIPKDPLVIKTDAAQAFITGCLAYLDEFDGVHATRFTFQLVPADTPGPGVSSSVIAPRGSHAVRARRATPWNDAD